MRPSAAKAGLAAIVSAVALGVGLAGSSAASGSIGIGTAPVETGGSQGRDPLGVGSTGFDPSLRQRGTAPREAIEKAERRAQKRWRHRRITATDSLRSKREPRWVLVNGQAGGSRVGLWSAWLKKRHGRWRVVRFADRAGADPPGVPCDISPAYSEPHC